MNGKFPTPKPIVFKAPTSFTPKKLAEFCTHGMVRSIQWWRDGGASIFFYDLNNSDVLTGRQKLIAESYDFEPGFRNKFILALGAVDPEKHNRWIGGLL